MNTSFEEKSVWIQLLSLIVVFGSYFFIALRMILEGITNIKAFIPLFFIATVFLVIILIAGHIVAAIVHRKDKPDQQDERDRLIAWRSESNSAWILGTGILVAIIGLVLSVQTVWIANLLLLFLFLSEVVKALFQIFYYRRGM